jgi:hypothetical protein
MLLRISRVILFANCVVGADAPALAEFETQVIKLDNLPLNRIFIAAVVRYLFF